MLSLARRVTPGGEAYAVNCWTALHLSPGVIPPFINPAEDQFIFHGECTPRELGGSLYRFLVNEKYGRQIVGTWAEPVDAPTPFVWSRWRIEVTVELGVHEVRVGDTTTGGSSTAALPGEIGQEWDAEPVFSVKVSRWCAYTPDGRGLALY